MNINNLNINYDVMLYNTLSQDSHINLNRKLISIFGSDLTLFVAFLSNQSKYHFENESLTKDKFFYATDEDIHIFTGMPRGRITKLKKQGVKKGLYEMKKIGIPQKTYYKINSFELMQYIGIDKSLISLCYEREFEIENPTENIEFSEPSLEKFSIRDLRSLCKRMKISYTGNDKKVEIINKILENQKEINPLQKEISISVQKKRPLNKISIKHKSIQWTKKLSTSGQKSCHKPKSNKHITNINNHDQEEKKVDLDFFENLFKEFKINFTKTNQEAVKKLLVSLSSQRKVEEYLRETYENIKKTPGVKDPARLFSAKIAKGERQVIPKAAMKKIMHSNSDQETENEEILIKQEKVLRTELKYLLGYVENNFKTPIEAYQDMVNFTKKKEYNSILIEKYLLKMKDCLKL